VVGKLTTRARTWAERREERIAGRNPWAVAVATAQASMLDRVTGLAAEMAFFALLSLVPLVVALGASLGSLEVLVGQESVNRGQAGVLEALGAVFSPQVIEGVLRPLVEGLLEETRGGVALSSVVAALWLASRVFTATIRALDLAYGVEERRGLVTQRLLALAFALGAVVAGSITLLLGVVGPLLGSGRELADRLGFGEAFTAVWAIGRWPFLVAVVVGFFATVYRFGPNVRNTWRQCLPGAILGVVLWLLSSFGLRLYLATAGSPVGRFEAGAQAAAVLGVVGAVLAAMLWVYVSSMALLVGGELNSVLSTSAPDGPRALDAGNGRG
jgi:membrane protein